MERKESDEDGGRRGGRERERDTEIERSVERARRGDGRLHTVPPFADIMNELGGGNHQVPVPHKAS